MALITESTFDPLHQYMGVVQQQGVPFLDADWNELDEVHRFARRIFLKWFVGNGVPNDSDIFRIEGTGQPNDFVIHSGIDPSTIPAGASNQEIGLRYVGYALVDGLEVFIQNTMKFSAQPLHVSNNPSPALLATTLGGGAINALKQPGADGVVVVYLDVWERLLTPDEESKLILPAIGIQSCARIKRDWVVRADRKLPTKGDPAPLYVAGHSYYQLATITRHNGVNEVNAGDVQDKRQVHLSLSNMLQHLNALEQTVLIPAFNSPNNQFDLQTGVTGQYVTLLGRNFTVGTPQVSFGGVQATRLSNITFSSIQAQIPPEVSGDVHVTITNEHGSVTSDDFIHIVNRPLFVDTHQFDPTIGKAGTAVKLFGFNFDGPHPSVTFGSVSATISSATANQIVTSVPSGVSGKVQIAVTTDEGIATSTESFTVLVAPAFADPGKQFSPQTDSAGNKIDLSGSGFDGPHLVVIFGPSTPATIIGTPTATKVSVTVPGGLAPLSQVLITVTTDGGTATSVDKFTLTS